MKRLAVVFLLLGAACTRSDPKLGEQRFACSSDVDCYAPNRCIDGECRAGGAATTSSSGVTSGSSASGSSGATSSGPSSSSASSGSSASSSGTSSSSGPSSSASSSSSGSSSSGSSSSASSSSGTASTGSSASSSASSSSGTSSTSSSSSSAGSTSAASSTGSTGSASTSAGSTGSTSAGSTGSTSAGSTGSSGTTGAASCTDQARNGTETDVDCGGDGGCPRCGDGLGCALGADCQSQVCDADAGTCAAPSCTDGVQNGAELGTDCGGGACPGCGVGSPCVLPVDCASGLCLGGVCAPVTCTNASRDGTETDVDCGGLCAPCADGLGCLVGADCQSRVCDAVAGTCAAPSCSDGVRNGSESATDCGGGACPGCAAGLACATSADCADRVCDADAGTCLAGTCGDQVRNRTETDTDCGGSDGCARCGVGKGCQGGTDCAEQVCVGNVCQAPSCGDGVRNGTEADTDCGGACPGCAIGQRCGSGADCAERVCLGGVCQAPTCTDLAQNGSETGTDCGGGACPGCATGGGCRVGADCANRVCDAGLCQAPSCNDLVRNGTESDVDCGGACPGCGIGQACAAAADCAGPSNCLGGACRCATVAGVDTASLTWLSVAGAPDAPLAARTRSGAVEFEGCDGGCGTAWPQLAVLPLAAPASTAGVSVAALPGGGAALAYVTGGTTPALHYLECAANCLDPASWSADVTVDSSSVKAVAPQLVVEGAYRAVGYGGSSTLKWAECSSGCTAAGGWGKVALSNKAPTGRVGAALGPTAGEPVRHLYGTKLYLRCTSGCTSSANWTSSGNLSGVFDVDEELRLDPSGAPVVAGLAQPNPNTHQVVVARCVASPCTNAANWTSGLAASDWRNVTPDRVGLQLDPAGLARVSYAASSGRIAVLLEGPQGSFTPLLPAACSGAQPAGALPALLAADGGLTLTYASSAATGLPDGGTLPSGQAWLTEGP